MNGKISIGLMSLFIFSNQVLSSEIATLSIKGKLVKHNTCEIKSTLSNYKKTLNEEIKCSENTALSIKYTDINKNTLIEVPVKKYESTIVEKENVFKTKLSKDIIININVI